MEEETYVWRLEDQPGGVWPEKEEWCAWCGWRYPMHHEKCPTGIKTNN